MLIPVSREIFLPIFVWSLAFGILSGAVYDIFRIRRVAFRIPQTGHFHNVSGRADTVITFFEDVLFSLLCTVVFILIAYRLSFGLPRWYSAVAYAGGFFLYRETVGVLVIRSAEVIIGAVCRVVRFIYRVAVMPLLRLITGTVLKLFLNLRRRCREAYTVKYQKRLIFALTSSNVLPQSEDDKRRHCL